MEDAPSTSHPGDELLRVADAVHAGEVSIAFKSGASDGLAGPAPR